MSQILVVTFTGPDRPGLVQRLASIVSTHGGNWEESRSASLAGRFAGILKVTVSADRADRLTGALRALEAEGLGVIVERGAAIAAPAGRRTLRLELDGADHEGIVHDVAHLLAGRGLNIEDLITDRHPAPESGSATFHVIAELSGPADVDVHALARDLERLAGDLLVEIELHEA